MKSSRAFVGKVEEDRSYVYVLILALIALNAAVVVSVLPGYAVIYISFLTVFLFSLKFKSKDLIKTVLLLFVFSGMMRRIAASDSGYFTPNDILILLPYVPIFILFFKNLKKVNFDVYISIMLYLISLLALFSLQQSLSNILWGIVNLVSVIIFGQISKAYLDEDLISFVINLGLITAFYIFFQKVSLPEYDVGWCQNRKSELIVLETCTSKSTRLWGTMESAINMACFLSVCFLLIMFQRKSRLFGGKFIKLLIIFVALFLTGTRTYIFLIPVAFLISIYCFKRVSISRFFVWVSCIVFVAIQLPSLAQFFGYESRWIERLNVSRLMGDQSLNERFGLIVNALDQITVKNFLIGDGIGSKSRGLSAIDNGYVSLMLEIGLPLAIVFLTIIVYRLKSIYHFQSQLVLQSWSVCILLIMANLSYVVLTGSSSVFFWLFFFAAYGSSYSNRVSVQ